MKKEIELLAPAGSIEQAMMCIESGCNAIYGGLKSWNARMNARNFSVDEYKKLIGYCHQNGVKFYMTLNTLFKDDELEEVIRLFSGKDFILPDAVIAADMGLISTISKKFPSVDIHASTQFGVTSVEDIDFLRKFNVKRVILARELTIDDIGEIRSKSDIQLEVFGYGSQCICFSGQCLWGGLTQERSGNRGRCPATCRDFYESNGRMGQLLYPQDINASEIINQLIMAGIDSIKIEGRFRSSKQISSIVTAFRKAIDDAGIENKAGTSENKNLYVGYLSNSIPVKGILNVLNPRTLLTRFDDLEYGSNDFTAVISSHDDVEVNTGCVCHPENMDEYYIKTVFSDALLNTNDGSAMTLVFVDNVLTRIDVINNIGMANTFLLGKKNLRSAMVSDVVYDIKNNIHFKLFDISSNKPEFSKIEYDAAELLKAIDRFNRRIVTIPRPLSDRIDAPGCEDYIQLNKAEMLYELKTKGFRNFIFNIRSIGELKRAFKYEDEQTNIIYRLPMLDFNHKMDIILNYLNDKTVMISRWAQLIFQEKFDFKEIYADYTLNAWNSKAMAILEGYGVKKIIAHPEITLNQNVKMVQNGQMESMAIYVSRIPIGYTRVCFGEIGICSKKCENTVFTLKNSTKEYFVHVFCDNEFGFRTLTTSFINAAYGELKEIKRIFDFSQMNDNEIQSVLQGTFSNIGNITSIYGREVL